MKNHFSPWYLLGIFWHICVKKLDLLTRNLQVRKKRTISWDANLSVLCGLVIFVVSSSGDVLSSVLTTLPLGDNKCCIVRRIGIVFFM